MRVDLQVIDDLAALLGIEDLGALQNVLENAPLRYRTFTRKKKDGTRRRLYVPDDSLKGVQKAVLQRVLTSFPQHSASHCRRGRSIVTNATAHLRKTHVSVCDLAQCFPTIGSTSVAAALRQGRVPQHLIAPLVRLCTIRNELPQGAPTSTAMLNSVLYPLDEQLNAAATRRGLTYTRYVDDLTFSGNRSPRHFLNGPVRRIVQSFGFELAAGKTRHWRLAQNPIVTGVRLTRAPSPKPALVRDIERSIAGIRRGEKSGPKARRRLLGQIAWVGSLWPKKARRLLLELRTASKVARRLRPAVGTAVRVECNTSCF